MDSMRNLRKVLPSATSRRQAAQPPETLLQAFRQAAQSITTLYKAAASEQEQAYKEGYRDALQGLLNFLDNERIGMQGGEGWRVRQWIAGRFESPDRQMNPASDSEEESYEDKRARSSSPVMSKGSSEDVLQPTPQRSVKGAIDAEAPARPESAPPATGLPATPDSESKHATSTYSVPAGDFSFRSSHQMPPSRDVDMDSPESQQGRNSSQNPSHTLQVNVIQRPQRTSTRRGNVMPRSANRTRGTGSGLGQGAGQKRSAIEMFWDISGLNDRDSSPGGGGKRGRFT